MALINCSECGKQISDKAISCPHCGYSESTQTQLSESESIDNEIIKQKNFQPLLEKGEKVLIDKELSSYLKSILDVDAGRATLTTHRIVFCGEIGNFMKLAAFPVLAIMTANPYPKIHLQILISDISRIEVKKHGFSKKLLIYTASGKPHAIQVSNLEKWKQHFNDANIEVIE